MRNYVGLDVSMQSTAICILDENGKRIHEGEVDSNPEAIHEFLLKTGIEVEQIGLESGNLTHYLKKGLLERKYQVIVMESRKMAAILATVINKTDRNDARGIAEALRVGHFRECVHRSDHAVEIRSLLHLRQTAVGERTHITNSIRGHLKVYGIKFGKKAGKTFRDKVEEAIKELRPRVQRTVQSLVQFSNIGNRMIHRHG
jgi:transposase